MCIHTLRSRSFPWLQMIDPCFPKSKDMIHLAVETQSTEPFVSLWRSDSSPKLEKLHEAPQLNVEWYETYGTQRQSLGQGVIGDPRRPGAGPGAYLVLRSERPPASHSRPQNQTPVRGPSSSPPSEGPEGGFGSSPTEGRQMGCPASCDCGKSTHNGKKVLV